MKASRFFCLSLFAGLLLSGAAARAGIVEDFQFNEAAGVVITSAVNSANGGNNFLSQNTATAQSAMDGLGSFRINKQTVTGQVGNTFNIANVTTGKVWLVADIAGWVYTATASSPTAERVRFAFLDNTDPVAAGSSTITAEMNIDRLPDNTLVLSGEAGGTGAVNIAADLPLSLSRSTNLRIVLELDKNLDQYSIYSKDGAGPYALLGTADLGASTLNAGDRDGNSVRFAFTGQFGDTGEFFDVDRIFVTDMNPIPEPSAFLMLGLATLVMWWAKHRRAK